MLCSVNRWKALVETQWLHTPYAKDILKKERQNVPYKTDPSHVSE